MPRTPLRAGLAACGGIADLTLEAARASPDFEVVAVQDPDPGALGRVGERYGIARRHRDFADLLSGDVDFVVLNSPNREHLPQVLAAAAAGKHCLVQKPMARSAAEAEQMVRAAATAGVRLGVTMFELGRPLHHEVRRMVAEGWLGEPVAVQACAAHALYLDHPPPAGDWRRDPEQVGGGAFLQLALHHVNLACWLLGDEVVAAAAQAAGGHTVFREETALAVLAFRGGALGHFAASWAADLWSFGILGTRGRVALTPGHALLSGRDPWEGDLLGYRTPGAEACVPMEGLAPALAAREAAHEVHGLFARWVAGEAEYPAPGEVGLRDLRVAEAVRRSAEEGACVAVG